MKVGANMIQNDKMESQTEEIDDERQIANMNVEGMPWYHEEKEEGTSGKPRELLQGKDLRRAVWSSVLASLLIGLIFSAFICLFVLFCTNVWLA